MTAASSSALIEPSTLARKIIGGDTVKVIDASWPAATAGFAERRISGSVFFDIDEIADHEATLPHMLPAASEFGRAVGRLGISNADCIVVYDQVGIAMAAARA